jgi:hypothetical protein
MRPLGSLGQKVENTTSEPYCNHSHLREVGMRLSLFAVAGLILFAVVSFSRAAPDLRAEGGDLSRLLQERYEAVLAEMEAKHALYRGGRVPLESLCDTVQRFATAAAEMADTPAERLHQYERAFDIAKDIEALVKQKFEKEVEPVQSMRLATYTRLDMEIKLRLARGAAGVERSQKKSGKDLPPAPVLGKAKT